MNTSNKNITFKGQKVEVKGRELKFGDSLPTFKLTGNDLSDVTENNYKGKTLIISVVPSLDTPVCSIQTKRFNNEAANLSSNVVILTVSRDVPFAQKRWCGAEGVERVVTASDYKYRTFGDSFGVELPELALLIRAVFVIDSAGKVVHVEYVKEITDEPDYASALQSISSLIS